MTYSSIDEFDRFVWGKKGITILEIVSYIGPSTDNCKSRPKTSFCEKFLGSFYSPVREVMISFTKSLKTFRMA